MFYTKKSKPKSFDNNIKIMLSNGNYDDALRKGLGGVGKLPAEKISRLRPVTFPASLSSMISANSVQSADTGSNEPIILKIYRKEEEE